MPPQAEPFAASSKEAEATSEVLDEVVTVELVCDLSWSLAKEGMTFAALQHKGEYDYFLTNTTVAAS